MANTKKPESSQKKFNNVIDGKQDLSQNQDQLRDLEEMLNPKKPKFATGSAEDFKQKISIMNLVDLQSMAVSAAIFPSGNRAVLKNKLIKEFTKVNTGGKGNAVHIVQPILDQSKLSEEDKKLFRID
jgi:hypothetical protein